MITISAVQLALDNPLNDPNSRYAYIINYIDLATTGVFVAEIFLKIFVYGLIINGEFSYLQSSANQLDLLVTVLSVVSLTSQGVQMGMFKVFRMFKVLRNLKFISRIPSFAIAIEALMNAVTNVFSVLIISVLFFMIFGVVGVNYFKGLFFTCDLSMTTWPQVNPYTEPFSKWKCLSYGGEWTLVP